MKGYFASWSKNILHQKQNSTTLAQTKSCGRPEIQYFPEPSFDPSIILSSFALSTVNKEYKIRICEGWWCFLAVQDSSKSYLVIVCVCDFHIHIYISLDLRPSRPKMGSLGQNSVQAGAFWGGYLLGKY